MTRDAHTRTSRDTLESAVLNFAEGARQLPPRSFTGGRLRTIRFGDIDSSELRRNPTLPTVSVLGRFNDYCPGFHTSVLAIANEIPTLCARLLQAPVRHRDYLQILSGNRQVLELVTRTIIRLMYSVSEVASTHRRFTVRLHGETLMRTNCDVSWPEGKPSLRES
jgi:hypothetical protein